MVQSFPVCPFQGRLGSFFTLWKWKTKTLQTICGMNLKGFCLEVCVQVRDVNWAKRCFRFGRIDKKDIIMAYLFLDD
jgi:hypothetical protein